MSYVVPWQMLLFLLQKVRKISATYARYGKYLPLNAAENMDFVYIPTNLRAFRKRWFFSLRHRFPADLVHPPPPTHTPQMLRPATIWSRKCKNKTWKVPFPAMLAVCSVKKFRCAPADGGAPLRWYSTISHTNLKDVSQYSPNFYKLWFC